MKRIYGLIAGLIITIALCPNVYGNGNGGGYGHHGDNTSGSVENTADSSVGDIGSDSVSRIDSSIKSITQIEESAQAIRLSVGECTEGSGASTRDGSFLFGGRSYTCDVADGVDHMLSVVPSLLNKAQSYPEGSKERDEALRKAQYIIDRVYVILADDMGDYLEVRGFTAKFGAVMRDMWVYFLGLIWWLA